MGGQYGNRNASKNLSNSNNNNRGSSSNRNESWYERRDNEGTLGLGLSPPRMLRINLELEGIDQSRVRDDPWFDERDNEGNVVSTRIAVTRGNNQRNLNFNRQHTIVETARREEHDSNGNYRTEYEDIPRVVRPINQIRERVNDSTRSQRRAARWRLNNSSAQVIKNKRMFKAGADQLRKELHLSHEQIVEGMKRNQFHNNEAATEGNSCNVDAQDTHRAQTNEDNTINELLEQWAGGAHGFVPEKKDENIIRLVGENVNNLGLYNRINQKMFKLSNLISRYQSDGMCMVEHGMNFGHHEATGDKRINELFSSIHDSRNSAGYNIHENFNRYTYGGTMVSTFSRLSSFVISQGVDKTGLGRWSWILVGSGDHRTIIVSAYQPQKSSNKRQRITTDGKMSGGGKVSSQHRRYFEIRGNCNNPRAIFTSQLVTQLKAWKAKGYEIILFADLNENIYTGPFSAILQQQPLLMDEQTLKSTGQQAPKSHQMGTNPIVGTFATPGIMCVNSYLSPHGGGVGDHRVHIHDFDAMSVLGIEYHKTVKPTGRSLRCENVKARKKYIKKLKQSLKAHRVYDKLEFLNNNKHSLPRETFGKLFNKFDTEVVQLSLNAEKVCNQFYNGTIEFSPIVGMCIRMIRVYKWIQKYKSGARVNKKNLRRTCKRMKLARPSSMTEEEVSEKIKEYKLKLKSLKETGPKLREEHLSASLSKARTSKKKSAIKAIMKIIRKEASRKRWKRISKCIRPRRGSAISRVTVPDNIGERTYSTRDGVEVQASAAIAQRYKTAMRAPIIQNQELHEDFGFLADTEATTQVLHGTYEYPESTEKYTRVLLQQAHEIYKRLPADEVETFISAREFQRFWGYIVKEKTQSSASRVHNGHYKAASYDKDLCTLHAAKLNLAIATGVPLARWSRGITILIEKAPGSTNISSFRAICLFEADGNYLNKFIYAKQMMRNAHNAGIIPAEQFAKSGSQANHGVIVSGLFCDVIRASNRVAAIESVDLQNCFDQVAHPVVSIALQSFKVNKKVVAMTLMLLQITAWHLRTSFGESNRSFGGTKEDPSMGLGQGNGMAPPGFTSMNTLMINGYNSLGHGVELASAWSGLLFILSAVIFVDDTDLLHMAEKFMTEEEFILKVQLATDDWAGIVNATGGSLKPPKCFWYMIAPIWNKGVPQLKTLAQLPSTPVTIPQPDGTRVPITLKDPSMAERKLGIYFAPNGDFSAHVDYIVKSGLHHSSCLKIHPIPPREARMSIDLVLVPKILYGAVTLSHPPAKLEKAFQSIYYKLLPSMGVNRCITKPYRMLPEKYQGLALPNPNIWVLAAKLILIREHWELDTTMGNMLTHAYQTFQMEVGLGGNIFGKCFKSLGHLASQGFFRNLWELAWTYKTVPRIYENCDLPVLRSNDRMMMDAVYDTSIFTSKELGQINRVRHHKKISSLGDLTCCDGRTIRQEMYTTEVGESTREFPVQQPIGDDFRVWFRALGSVCRLGTKLNITLGDYTTPPHNQDTWFANNSMTSIYHKLSTSEYEHYTIRQARRTTRFGAKYMLEEYPLAAPTLDKRVTPKDWTGTTVSYHSSCRINAPRTASQPTSMMDIIKAQENKSLWTSLTMDGYDEGEWIYTSLMGGTLVIGHDGSYQGTVATDICAGSAVIHCVSTDQYAELTWVEKSDNKTASNYRGEILGAIATQLLIKFAIEGRDITGHKPLVLVCDNMGVVKHGNEPRNPLSEKQSQADLLGFLKNLISTSRVGMKLRHVHSHSDKHTRREDMNQDQLINDRADKIVGKALRAAIEENKFITSVFPGEKVSIQVSGVRISGSPKVAITEEWGKRVAIELFHQRKVVHKQLFPHIYWKGMTKVMRSFPVMFRTWITKHVSHFNGTNRQLSRRDPTIKNVCPNCNRPDESTSHINRCPDVGRRAVRSESVKELKKWLECEQTDPSVTHLICKYLNYHGDKKMLSLLSNRSTSSKYRAAVLLHDALGWTNFLEGRISVMWVELRREDIRVRKLQRNEDSWARGLMRRLLQMTHQQWSYRNATVHLKIDGCTRIEHNQLLEEIDRCLDSDPGVLLRDHRQLMFADFEKLAKGTVNDKQLWVAEFHAARSLARHVGTGTRVTLRTRYPQAKHPRMQTVRETVQADSHGSLRWRRRIRI